MFDSLLAPSSHSTGYPTGPGDCKYPKAWEDLILGYCPYLGYTDRYISDVRRLSPDASLGSPRFSVPSNNPRLPGTRCMSHQEIYNNGAVVQSPYELDLFDEMTVLCWAKRIQGYQYGWVVNFKHSRATDTRIGINYGETNGATDTIIFSITKDTVPISIKKAAASVRYEWQRIVGRITGGTTLELFVNGVNVGDTAGTEYAFVISDWLLFGMAPTEGIDGEFGSLEIYKRAFDDAEIFEDYWEAPRLHTFVDAAPVKGPLAPVPALFLNRSPLLFR